MDTVGFHYPAAIAAAVCFAIGGLWYAMSLGVIYLFEQRSLKLRLINRAATRW